MINDIYIIENVVSKPYQDYIKKLILEGNISWSYRPNLGNDTPVANPDDTNPAPGIIHVVTNQHGIQSDLFYPLLPICELACQKINFDLKAVIGGRTFIQEPATQDRGFTKIHTDYTFHHIVVLYYVIDADGDTVLFDQTTKDIPKNQLDPSALTVARRIAPKQGTAVIFDGSRYHCTTLPLQGKRCIVNFNLC